MEQMDAYYEILGIKPGASQQEIKKAYFKQLRKHSPESDPEMFQKIRRAYDALKSAADAPKGPVFAPLQLPLAKEMLGQIMENSRNGDFEGCMNACEEAWEAFPEERRFLYLLIQMQRKCGKTGKAVKSAELLVSMEPDNRWFLKELAFSYSERGYTKKALEACARAYAAGCRDNDFILAYSLECNSNHAYDRGVEILLEMIRQTKRWSKENISDLAEAYIGLMSMETHAKNMYYEEVLELFCKDLKQYSIYLAKYIKQFITMLLHMCLCNRYVIKNYQSFAEACAVIETQCHEEEEKEFLEAARTEVEYAFLSNDARLNENFLYAYEAYFYSEEEEEDVRKFSMADAQLCMLAEREQILGQAEIIRADYPHFYERIRDFLEKLESRRNLSYLKNGLLKVYCQFEPYISGGAYFEKYPEEKAIVRGRVINEEHTDQPYTREGKKIGRNDPCPCGSGKKYKYCCMNL